MSGCQLFFRCQLFFNFFVVSWYNKVHKHSGIKYVTPEERHNGLDKQILLNRKATYIKAQRENPSRWQNNIRNWDFIDEVSLNPESKNVA